MQFQLSDAHYPADECHRRRSTAVNSLRHVPVNSRDPTTQQHALQPPSCCTCADAAPP
jgi:hypothetical protein